MKSRNMYYVVVLRNSKHNNYLLWREGGGAQDSYACFPHTTRLIAANSVRKLLEGAEKLGYKVSNQKPVVADIDLLLKRLKNVRPLVPCSTITCQILLDGWNTIDDLSRSIGYVKEGLSRAEEKSLRQIYDKLFYGNNLPAVTPNDKNYRPIFTISELKAMRSYLRRLWGIIIDRGQLLH